MKTLNFSDRLDPVFVKELRQSIHDKSLPYAAAAVVAAQLIVGYILWATGLRTGIERQIFTGSLAVFIVMLSTLRMFWAQRAGLERGLDGFDPQSGTGFPAWRTVAGRFAAETFAMGCLAVLALPWFVFFGLTGGLPPDLAETAFFFVIGLFVAGEGFHFITSFRLGKKYSAFMLLPALFWIVWLFLLPTPCAHCRLGENITLLLAGFALICGQIQNRMPVRANRGTGFKCALLATTLFAAWNFPDVRDVIFFGAGWLFMFGALWERRAPSRRQIEGAPGSRVLRFASLLFGSGVLSGFLLSTALCGASIAFGKASSLAPILLSVAYLQAALFAACKWRVPPFAAWLVLSIAANLPCVSGELFPWATVLSANAEDHVGRELAVAAAAAAYLATLMLNGKLYWNFAKRYFERETGI